MAIVAIFLCASDLFWDSMIGEKEVVCIANGTGLYKYLGGFCLFHAILGSNIII